MYYRWIIVKNRPVQVSDLKHNEVCYGNGRVARTALTHQLVAQGHVRMKAVPASRRSFQGHSGGLSSF